MVYLPIERVYMAVLGWVMRRRWVAVVASVATLASVVPLMKVVPKGFLPKSDEAQFEVQLRAPEGTSLEATKILGERVAREVARSRGVASTLVTIGDTEQRTPNFARVYVKLTEPAERKLSQDEMMDLDPSRDSLQAAEGASRQGFRGRALLGRSARKRPSCTS